MSKQLKINFEKNDIKYAPSFEFESKFNGVVAGIDEVGIGSWIGPVMATAVILTPEVPKNILGRLHDSKKLSFAKREQVYKELIQNPHVIYGIGSADLQEIETLNIRQATFLAMARAVDALEIKPDAVIVDGNARPTLPCPIQMIVKGDQRSYSIAAASIIAKVTRDSLVREYSESFPDYGWAKNAGYGTKQHKIALEENGVTPYHRKGYAPVSKLLARKVR